MDAKNIGRWVQTVSAIAVVIGLGLVVAEIRQTKQLTRAQIAADSREVALSRALAFMGENPMAAMAKACDPDSVLTREDALVLNYVFTSLYSTVGRSWEVGRIAGFDDERWKLVARANFPLIFSTQHGRAWWPVFADGRTGPDHPVRVFGDEVLAAQGPPACSSMVEAILDADRNKAGNR